MSNRPKRLALHQVGEIKRCLVKSEPFVAASMSGAPHDPALGPVPSHRLKVDALTEAEAAAFNAADYVVKSYDTPIAWRAYGIWHVPNVTYSTTTSARHMPKLRAALDLIGVQA